MAEDAQKTSNVRLGDTHNGTHSGRHGANTSVNGDVLNSRSASPNSSFSCSDTLVNLSDAGSTTTVEEVTNPNVAGRRLKFKEEFELADHVEELNGTKANDRLSTVSTTTDNSSFSPTTKPPESMTLAKTKANGRKKPGRSNGQKFNFCSCNIYTGGNASDKIAATESDGGVGRKAMLGGPSMASGMVGCTVM